MSSLNPVFNTCGIPDGWEGISPAPALSLNEAARNRRLVCCGSQTLPKDDELQSLIEAEILTGITAGPVQA